MGEVLRGRQALLCRCPQGKAGPAKGGRAAWVRVGAAQHRGLGSPPKRSCVSTGVSRREERAHGPSCGAASSALTPSEGRAWRFRAGQGSPGPPGTAVRVESGSGAQGKGSKWTAGRSPERGAGAESLVGVGGGRSGGSGAGSGREGNTHGASLAGGVGEGVGISGPLGRGH